MAKATVILTQMLWDSTNGFSAVVDYALQNAGTFNHTSFTHSFGLSAVINTQDDYKDGIETAVIADALSRFNIVLVRSDLLLLF